MSPGSGETSVPKVFICYRRDETAGHAGRLCDSMESRYGKDNVFIDVDMAPGVDFVERITEVIGSCQALIVVMGPSWATVEGDDGGPRIADPDDVVRLELETALKRSGVLIVPCLVHGAQMPKPEHLPGSLKAMARRNALELSNSRWAYDVERLHTTLDELLTGMTQPRETTAPRTPAPEPATPAPVATPTPVAAAARPLPAPERTVRPAPARLILEGVLVAGVTAYLARWLGNLVPTPDSDPGAIAAVTLRRAETWALTGAALALWLAIRTGGTRLFRAAIVGLLVGAIGGALGGLIWAVPVILADPNIDKVDLAQANRIQIGSLAVTGAFIGALIGSTWAPRRLGAGLTAGLAGGALTQLILNGLGWDDGSKAAKALTFGFVAAAITAIALAALVALDARRAGAALPAPAPRGP